MPVPIIAEYASDRRGIILAVDAEVFSLWRKMAEEPFGLLITCRAPGECGGSRRSHSYRFRHGVERTEPS